MTLLCVCWICIIFTCLIKYVWSCILSLSCFFFSFPSQMKGFGVLFVESKLLNYLIGCIWCHMSLLYFFVEYLCGPHNNRLYGLGVAIHDSAIQCIWAMCVKLEVGNDHIEVQAIRLQSVVLFEFGASRSWSGVCSKKFDRWTKVSWSTNLQIAQILNDSSELDSSIKNICFSYHLPQSSIWSKELYWCNILAKGFPPMY